MTTQDLNPQQLHRLAQFAITYMFSNMDQIHEMLAEGPVFNDPVLDRMTEEQWLDLADSMQGEAETAPDPRIIDGDDFPVVHLFYFKHGVCLRSLHSQVAVMKQAIENYLLPIEVEEELDAMLGANEAMLEQYIPGIKA